MIISERTVLALRNMTERITMNELLRNLHDRFYIPLLPEEDDKEAEACYRRLREVLDRPERKLVLRLIDAKDRKAERLSVDSFICGFRLATELAAELGYLERTRGLPVNKDCDVKNLDMTEE